MPAYKIFIARDHDGAVIGIVLAEDERIANAYFVGRGQIPHDTGVIDPNDSRLGVLGLVTLLKTKEISWSEISEIADRRRTGGKPLRVEDHS